MQTANANWIHLSKFDFKRQVTLDSTKKNNKIIHILMLFSGITIEEVPQISETKTTSVPSNLIDGGKLTFSTIFAGPLFFLSQQFQPQNVCLNSWIIQ
jgi:hypothetical protein